MKLIVGLGNPGPRYHLTRHNVGFDVINAFADRHFFPPCRTRFDGLVTDHSIGGEKVILLAPQTFMNASGRSVRQCLDFFQIDRSDVLVVVDDMNLDTARQRLRGSGSAGGQKGLADIVRHLGGEDFARLRIGIGRPPGRMDASSYVLQRFTEHERTEIDVAIQEAVAGLELWVREGLDAAMNVVNKPLTNDKTTNGRTPKNKLKDQDASDESSQDG